MARGPTRPEWYVSPFGSAQPTDPTRYVTTLETACSNIREKVGVKADGTITDIPSQPTLGKWSR